MSSTLLKQIKSITESEENLIANLSNITALIHEDLNVHWTGFYFAEGDQLVLGPFQGPVACTRIPYGKGVCGSAWSESKTLVVDDVHKFPGHIACSALSNSEIVIPLIKNEKVIAVLDIDSIEFSFFSDENKQILEEICSYIETLF